jgi:hypothetical protein
LQWLQSADKEIRGLASAVEALNNELNRLKQRVDSQAVRVLFRDQGQEGGNNARKIVRIGPLPNEAVVLVNVSGQAGYSGSAANAGIRVVLEVDNQRVASSYSFEAFSSSIIFSATTSHAFVLPQGESRVVTSYIEPGHPNLRDAVLKSNVLAFSVVR